jgi:hypothetical protein
VNHGKTELKVRGSAIKDDIILMKPKIPYNAGEQKLPLRIPGFYCKKHILIPEG